MTARAIIRQGDPTSHGGTVLEGFSTFEVYGKPASGIGHKGYCPRCKRDFVIVAGAENFTFCGTNVAVEGMQTSCGAVLIATQHQALVDNVPGTQHAPGLPVQTGTSSSLPAYDMHWILKGDQTGQPLANVPYKITLENGTEIIGQTDENGLTRKVSAPSAIIATIIAPYHEDNHSNDNSDEIDSDCSCCAY